jgi:hypothetical protein
MYDLQNSSVMPRSCLCIEIGCNEKHGWTRLGRGLMAVSWYICFSPHDVRLDRMDSLQFTSIPMMWSTVYLFVRLSC